MTHTIETKQIPYIPGDGIGAEIWQASQAVIDHAVAKTYNGQKKIEWTEVLAGEKAFNETGDWLPEATLEAIKQANIAIKGPLTTPVGEGVRSINVALRQQLDLYACVRPVRYFKGVPSPLKEPEKTNMVIFRENTEDVYAGIEFTIHSDETKKLIDFLTSELAVTKIRFPETSAIGIKPISQEGSQRLVTAAIEYALLHQEPSVTLVHKGNIMKFTEGGFKNWGYDIAESQFKAQTFTMRTYQTIQKEAGVEAANDALKSAQEQGKVIIKDVIADNFLQQILLYPEKYAVIATTNLNGDYVSDALAAQVGGIGISPGGNINYDTGAAIFEATHGTAPDIVGLGKANPCSLLLSAVMMLEYLGWQEAADAITQAIEQALITQKVTSDFADQLENATCLTTQEFGEFLITLI